MPVVVLVPAHESRYGARMTESSATRSPWNTPTIEVLTDGSMTADQVAPIRNGNNGSLQATT